MKLNNISDYKVILTIVFGLLILFYIFDKLVFIYVATLLVCIGVFSNYCTRLISKYWMGLASLLNKIMPKIILGLIYFLVLCPLAFLARLLYKKDELMLKSSYETYFKGEKKEFVKDFFEKTW